MLINCVKKLFWLKPEQWGMRFDLMPLAVERHEGQSLWLMAIRPDGPSVKLAKFLDSATAAVWISEHNAAMLAAKEAGRSGL